MFDLERVNRCNVLKKNTTAKVLINFHTNGLFLESSNLYFIFCMLNKLVCGICVR